MYIFYSNFFSWFKLPQFDIYSEFSSVFIYYEFWSFLSNMVFLKKFGKNEVSCSFDDLAVLCNDQKFREGSLKTLQIHGIKVVWKVKRLNDPSLPTFNFQVTNINKRSKGFMTIQYQDNMKDPDIKWPFKFSLIISKFHFATFKFRHQWKVKRLHDNSLSGQEIKWPLKFPLIT